MQEDHSNTLVCEPAAADTCAVDESYYAHRFAPTFRELRREEHPLDFDDVTRPEVLKTADWKAIYELCHQSLAGPTKDLRIACHLVEAGLRVDGLCGFCDALAQLNEVVDTSWESLIPIAQDDSHETRATPVENLLDDPDRGVCLPNTLRSYPLFGLSPRVSYNKLVQLTRSTDPNDQDRLSHFRSNVPPEHYREIVNVLEECDDHLNRLSKSLQLHMGDEAPALLNLRAALTDIRNLVAAEMALLGVYSASSTTNTPDLPSDTQTPAASTDLLHLDREGLYYLLDQAADRLRGMEPHSPIPYLVKRAVRLGRLPFPALMKHVIREESILTELNREFGIADSEGHTPVA
ncbi:type VI secretion system protein TssA [Aeoliella mucimassa]|uniref:ImpA N-terminal domain-containing protein n=1 Tax=Aeoliella mucimassa TaxID=2527972 RepID=A0A518AUG1_9BACT|nr:type VI secretion system ImpA family N-terminal domain-containing protein [Aeoliella mucimassa]QDU58363.1 hypothetical protein Pan181_45970 [Aeoliella mucimassa]